MIYRRVQISVFVTLQSALHVGTGEESPLVERANNSDPDARYARTYRHGKRAAIPASSLRGIWRRAINDATLRDRYFGPDTGQRGHLTVGWLRVSDLRISDSDADLRLALSNAPLPDFSVGTAVTHGIRMEPITGTVKDGSLWAYEYVPPGVKFKLVAEIVPPPGEMVVLADLNALMKGLGAVGSSPTLSLGGASSRGLGLARVDGACMRGLTEANLRKWLVNGGTIDSMLEPIAVNLVAPERSESEHRIPLELFFPRGLLAGEPGLVKPHLGGREDDMRPRRTTDTAGHQFARDRDGRPIIRGSELRGLLRAHSEKIMATAIAAAAPGAALNQVFAAATAALMPLFGSTAAKGRIAIRDTDFVEGGVPLSTLRAFVAIDRLTGGAVNGRLYDANVANPCTLRTELVLRLPLAAWEKGLLLHLARDALEGDLAIGWGKSKGIGRLFAKSGEVNAGNWRENLPKSANEALKEFDQQVKYLASIINDTNVAGS